MDTTKFATAQKAYDVGDYPQALEEFLNYAQGDSTSFVPGEKGYIHHMIGNCLIKDKKFDQAIEAYRTALGDAEYPRHAAINVNLGMALSAIRDHETAVLCFEQAVGDSTYETPHKAFSAMGNALLKLGRPAEAGVAYRKAALDENNPDPARCLVNLGVCFMALDRPYDAVEAYVTALEFDTAADARNKTCANLGQAYVATGRMREAVNAFEAALKDGTYTLKDSALLDYDHARASIEIETNPERGLDVFEQEQYSVGISEEFKVIPPPDDTGFFTLSDAEIDARGRSMQRKERKLKNVGLKIFLVFALLILLLLVAAGFAYYKGYGWPMQEQVVKDMFAAYAVDESVADYWADASTSDIELAMACVGKTADVEINSVSRTMTDSEVVATATLSEGGQLSYNISMGRDMLGWKVTNIELDFASYPDA
ncbi:MAG: tetratricopeptide repeat protein [Actinobacteria bacterium]|nr:tetratricopeptide repeat protein [Actinomycetota bacterium]